MLSTSFTITNLWVGQVGVSGSPPVFQLSRSVSLQDGQLLASSSSSNNSLSEVHKSSTSLLLLHSRRTIMCQTALFYQLRCISKYRIKVSSLISLFKDFHTAPNSAHRSLVKVLEIANIKPLLRADFCMLVSFLT